MNRPTLSQEAAEQAAALIVRGLRRTADDFIARVRRSPRKDPTFDMVLGQRLDAEQTGVYAAASAALIEITTATPPGTPTLTAALDQTHEIAREMYAAVSEWRGY